MTVQRILNSMKHKALVITLVAFVAVSGTGWFLVHNRSQSNLSSKCDPNYSGACVPNVYPADVDCAGGSGNGPYYVQGPVRVTGTDRYRLDGNHDGVGCQ